MFDKVEKDAKRAKLMAKIGAGAQVLGQVGGMLDKGTGNQQLAAKTMQGAAAGAQMGMIAGPIGAGVGAVIGGVLGFLKGSKLKKDAKAAGKALGMEVSQELAKQIQDTAKDLKIDIKSAALLNLSSAMAESKKAAGTFAPQVASLMKGIADGSIPAAQGLEQVGEAFTKIADEAMKAGTVGSREMVALIKASRDMKLDSPEIKAFVSEQLSRAAAGFAKFAALFKKSTQEEVDKLGEEADKAFAGLGDEAVKKLAANTGMVFGAVFNALVSEQGIIGAVDQMKDSFETLRTRLLETLGEDAVTKILGPFGAAFDTIGNEKLRPLFEGIDGLSQAMQGLANSGFLSLEQFGAIQQATKTLFDEAVAGGADMKTALLAVSPSIQAAISAAQEFGVPLDADTQKLKDLAEQNGITFKTDPMRAMLDVMVEIAKVLGADIPDSVAKMRASVEGGTAATTTAAEEAATAAQTAKEAFDAGMKESMGDNTKEGWVAKFGEAVQAGREAVTEFTTMQQTAAFAALQTAQTVGAGVSAAAGASILSMAQAAEAGSAQAAAALQASLQSGALSVGDLANDPAWAALVTQLSSDVPEAARAAAAAIAAIIANVPGAINIPVNVTNGGGGATPEPPPPETPEGFAGGTQGWRSFSSKGTPVVLHNTEAVIRPGDPVLPGQVGGNTTTVHLNINENPMQTAQTVEQMRRFTLRAAERELSKNLSGRIEAGKA
jgi:gas vesicle protein